MTTFSIELLPARHGDCLWIEYGEPGDLRRILIDGGPVGTFEFLERRLQQVPPGERVFELMVLTHVDADHVEGLIRLFADKPLPFKVKSVWFNGWRQMNPKHGFLGPVQGEFLSALLADRASKAWDMDAPPWSVPDQGTLPATTLDGGMRLTLLSPDAAKLKTMAKEWNKAVKAEGLEPGDLDAAWEALAGKKKFLPKKGLLGTDPDLDALLKKQFTPDQAKANGSSIALLAEHAGKSALLLADAHPGVVVASLKRLCAQREKACLDVDAVKVSHHGSKKNTNDALLGLVRAPTWLISSNGDQFHHPDATCIARILKVAKPMRLCFNYESDYTRPWLADSMQQKHGYTAVVRPQNALSLKLDL
jgi:hypothetical protein